MDILLKTQLDEISVPLDSLKENDDCIKFVNNFSCLLELNYFFLIKNFYLNLLVDYNSFMYNTFDPVFTNRIFNKSRYRFIIFKVDDDYVFVVLNVVVPLFAKKGDRDKKSFEILKPISLNKCKESEIKVLEVLNKFPEFKGVFVSEDKPNKKYYRKNNFYNTREDFYRKFDKSSYKSKNLINRLKGMIDVVTNAENDFSSEYYIKKVMDYWIDEKVKIVGKKNLLYHLIDLKVFLDSVKFDGLRVNLFMFKGIPLAYSIVENCYGKFSGGLFQRAITVSKDGTNNYLKNNIQDIDDRDIHYIYHGLSRFVTFTTQKIEFDGGQDVFYHYSDGSLKGLSNYKNQNFCNTLYYNRYPVSEYISLIK